MIPNVVRNMLPCCYLSLKVIKQIAISDLIIFLLYVLWPLNIFSVMYHVLIRDIEITNIVITGSI